MTPIAKSLLNEEPELFGVERAVPWLRHGHSIVQDRDHRHCAVAIGIPSSSEVKSGRFLGNGERFSQAIALERSSFCAQTVRSE
jgi:hypothetical protein